MDAFRRLIGLSALLPLLASTSGGTSPGSPARLEFVDDDCLMMATVVGDQRVRSYAGSKFRVSCTKSADHFACKYRPRDPKDTITRPSSSDGDDLQILDDTQGILVLGSPPMFREQVYIYKRAARYIWTTWGMQGTDGVYQKQCTGNVRIQ